MKIAIITSPFGYLPPYGFGAVEKLWFNIASVLARSKNEIQLISKKNKQKFPYKSIENIIIRPINGFDRKGSIFEDLILDFIYSLKALSELNNCDVLVMNTFWSPFLSVFFKSKFSISVYNIQRVPKKQFDFMKHIDRFSCVSLAVYNELFQQSPHLIQKAIIIGNPIDISIFQPRRTKNSKNFICIVYAGRIHPEKGIDILVKACDCLVSLGYDLKLNLIGPRLVSQGGGGDSFIRYLNEISKKNTINWIDPIADPEALKNEIYKGDIFCYPSIAAKGETFGVAPLEAMASGIPTIVSDLDCFKDFIDNGVNGLIFNHKLKDPELELSNKIKMLIDNHSLMDSISKNGAQTSLNFSNEVIANMYLEDFTSLLNKKYGKGL